MSRIRMGRGSGGRATPRGTPLLPLGLLVVAALSVLAGVSPPTAAGQAPTQQGTLGPGITALALTPNPMVPPDPVWLTATAEDTQSVVIRAEYFFDNPGASGFGLRMSPAGGSWGHSTQGVYWSGTYNVFTQTLGPGPHVVLVHAQNAAGNWGEYASLSFFAGSAETIGPPTDGVDLSPATFSTGTAVTIRASVADRYGTIVQAAELFFDRLGEPGSGIAMNATDGFDSSLEIVVQTLVPSLPFGNHTVWVHASNGIAWGAPANATFLVRAPSMTLRLAANATSARPGDLVSYEVQIENHGNAAAVDASVQVALPPTVTYLDDTAGAHRIAGTSYGFASVPTGTVQLTVRGVVAATADVGSALDATATLEFTNDVGYAFPAVSAVASGAVQPPEVALAILAPGVLYAGESATVGVEVTNTALQTIPTIDVSLPSSPWTHVTSDSAASAGGVRLGDGSWRFTNVAQGVRLFEITETVSMAATDRASLIHTVQATYRSAAGVAVSASGNAVSTVGRPLFTMSIDSDVVAVSEGGRVVLSIHFENLGSAAASSAALIVTLPSGLTRAGGNPPTTSAADRLEWDFGALPPS